MLLVLSQVILFVSCGGDDDNDGRKYDSDGYFVVEVDNTQYKYYASTYGAGGILSIDKRSGILTMLTLNVKGNQDYDIYTGGDFSIGHSLQGTGEYKIVSYLDFIFYVNNTNEKVLYLSARIGAASSSNISYTFDSSSSYQGKAILTEKDGKYYIKIEEPVTLKKFIVHGTTNESIPDEVKIWMSTDGILYKEE